MSENRTLLVESAQRLFRDLVEDRRKPFAELWPAVDEMDFSSLLVAEEHGGFGGTLGDAFAVVRLAGHAALPLPLPEALIGRLACAQAGVEAVLPTLCASWDGGIEGGRFTGVATAIPWGREADVVVLAAIDRAIILRTADGEIVRRDESPAGEPRDSLRFAGADVTVVDMPAMPYGALLRTAQIAGAMDAALELSIGYANDRVQFGRSIGKFQTIQHNLAIFAEEAAAAVSAGEAAARAADAGDARFEIASAKCRASKAAQVGHAISHAVHGAIGFTHEYPLNHLTRRLIGWRSEFGGQSFWGEWLGRAAIEMGRNDFWAALTRRSDLVSAHYKQASQAAA